MTSSKVSMSKLKQISKKLQDSKQIQILLSSQKTQYSLLQLALAVSALTAMGVLGRAATQFIPDIEPLTPLAISIGFFFGPVAGFISGASGFYFSNFLVWGGQGPWTVFQSLGAGIAGLVGGVLGFGNKSRRKILVASLIGVTLYELIVTIGMGAINSLVVGSFFSTSIAYIIFYLITSLPFSLVHIGSGIGWSTFFYEFKEQIKKLKGGKVIEKEVLGLRSRDGDSGWSVDKMVPFFYSRKTIGDDKGEHDSRVWHIERKLKNDNDE